MHVGKKLEKTSWSILWGSKCVQPVSIFTKTKRPASQRSRMEWLVLIFVGSSQARQITALKRSNAGKKNVEMTPTASDQRDITGVGFGVVCCLGVGKSSSSFGYGTRCAKKMGQC